MSPSVEFSSRSKSQGQLVNNWRQITSTISSSSLSSFSAIWRVISSSWREIEMQRLPPGNTKADYKLANKTFFILFQSRVIFKQASFRQVHAVHWFTPKWYRLHFQCFKYHILFLSDGIREHGPQIYYIKKYPCNSDLVTLAFWLTFSRFIYKTVNQL